MSIRALDRRPSAARGSLVITTILTCFAAPASTTPVTVAASGACLFFTIVLLWHGDDPPILLLPPLFQWTEVAIWPLSTIWQQVPIDSLSPYGADLERAALYGLAGVAALSAGLAFGASRSRTSSFSARLMTEVTHWRFREISRIAFSAMGIGYGFAALSGVAGPARELFHQASTVRYGGLFILAYWCLAQRSHSRVLIATMIFEIVFNMTGFFADFKGPVLTFVVAALAARSRVRFGDLLIVVGAGALLILIAVFWSVIKPDYRLFLNKGTGDQVQLMPMTERLSYLAKAAAAIDRSAVLEGMDRLVSRHGYIEFLGLTLENVPRTVAHEDGQLTLNVLAHITMPRFVFPGKPVLSNDTEIMAKYTGLPFSWNEQTSISIGHLGELYIDFGFSGGLFAMAVLGFIIGSVYRMLRNYRSASALLTAGLCLMVALPAAYFGTAYVKLVGALTYCSVMTVAIQRYALPKILPMLRQSLRSNRRSANASRRR